MSTIDDVITWANTLPSWQGDAVRRLLENGEKPLSAEDYLEVLALAKAELKLASPPDLLKPVPPAPGKFSGVPETKMSVKLLSIDDVKNANIIKSGQIQPFAESGVTVLYGGNGSGKSGYSRILKLACKARDKDELILPNVFEKSPSGPPTATLKIKQDNKPKDIVWIQGTEADSILTNITVFDGRCARVITDDRNEIAYLPYGADVFQKTAELIQRVKADVEAEITEQVAIQDSAVVADTPSGIFLKALSENTKDEEIQAATAWSTQDETELTIQEELSRTSDSTKATQEIARLVKSKERVVDASKMVAELVASCTDLTNDAIEKSLKELNVAKLAHTEAVAERQTPETLQGVASTNQWEILYNAAKKYSEEVAYLKEPFPKTTNAVCVLCQQPLSEEAIARFERFKKYMEDATNSLLTEKRKALASIRELMEGLTPLSGPALESICDEISSLDIKVADNLRAYHGGISVRKIKALALLKEEESPEKVALLPPWPVSPQEDIRKVGEVLTEKIAGITKAAKPEEYQKLLANVTKLKARKALSLRKVDLTTFLVKARINATIRRAASTLRTQEITKQGTALIRKNLTPELLAAFKTELEALGSTRVRISVKPTGAEGETAHQMLLEGAPALGSARMSQVLSEGETRVIALAGFLAELKLAKHSNGIVFDDPVSSLDHVFTRKIAERLACESLTRQVIIFTHNIAFLMELQDSCLTLAQAGTPVEVAVHTLRRDAKSAGITTNGAPWYALKVYQRAHYLDQLAHKIKPLYQDNMPEYNKEAAYVYGLLREAWESCIEDDLFYNVVCRYRNSVQTLKLIQVSIEDTDIHQVELNMAKASTWMTGHAKSKALDQDRPAPDELLNDIQALRDFSKLLVGRRKETVNRRKQQLKP